MNTDKSRTRSYGIKNYYQMHIKDNVQTRVKHLMYPLGMSNVKNIHNQFSNRNPDPLWRHVEPMKLIMKFIWVQSCII